MESIIFLKFLLLILGKGRAKDRERVMDVGAKHGSVACCMFPQQGPNLQPRQVP